MRNKEKIKMFQRYKALSIIKQIISIYQLFNNDALSVSKLAKQYIFNFQLYLNKKQSNSWLLNKK